MNRVLRLLVRGLLLRCPNCGKGKLYRRGFKMYDQCQVCGWRFEREEGYWTGAIAINLIVTEFAVTAAVIPLAIWLAVTQGPIVPFALLFLPLPILLPFLFFRHAKSLWMTVDFIIHPVEQAERKQRAVSR